MLAKDNKILTLLKQRTFIEHQLSNKALSRDGDPSYLYVGHVYKENVTHFEAEGYQVTCISGKEAVAKTGGFPIYVFVPNDVLIGLNDEELEEAENYTFEGLEEELKAMAGRAKSAAGSFFDFLMNCANCENEDDGDEKDAKSEE